jgi:transcriptional regulator of acetoin/glycerol metabolism
MISLLTLHEGNVLAVSKALGVRRTQVYRWLQKFGIQVDMFRRKAKAGSNN